MKAYFKLTFLTLLSILFIITPVLSFTLSRPVQAQTEEEEYYEEYDYYGDSESINENRFLNRMTNIAQIGGYATDRESASVPRTVGLIINALLSITGLIFIILTVIAGFNWMTSGGNEEKVKKSKDTLTASVIGLIITLSAWTIWNFIFRNLIL